MGGATIATSEPTLSARQLSKIAQQESATVVQTPAPLQSLGLDAWAAALGCTAVLAILVLCHTASASTTSRR